MTERYFDIKRDNQYPCFCQACLVGKTEDEMSKRDIRYCIECQQVIEQEYALIAERQGRITRYKPILRQEKTAPVEIVIPNPETKMSTLNQQSLEVDKLEPRVRKSTYKKRELPIAEIQKANEQGLGSKAIATRLKGQGIKVSYKTIQRVLSGERT